METFESKLKYDCIVLRYCIGYLDAKAAAKVLKKLGSMLTPNLNLHQRAASSTSYILVQDQVVPEDRDIGEDLGQQARRQTILE